VTETEKEKRNKEIEKERCGDAVRNITCIKGKELNCTPYRFYQGCPFVLLVKVERGQG
jgi:hypothetical protein